MKTLYILIVASALLSFLSCTKNKKDSHSIIGTWQLISVETIEGNDTTIDFYTEGIKGIKMFNDTFFSFFQHDINHGLDSTAVFVSGGGKYELNGNSYTEYLEYCNIRVYENNSFSFTIERKGDTLIQRGTEEVEAAKVNKYIIETYSLVKE